MITVTHPQKEEKVLHPQDLPFNVYFTAVHSLYGFGLFLNIGCEVGQRTVIKVDTPNKFWRNPNEFSGFSNIRLVEDVNISYNY